MNEETEVNISVEDIEDMNHGRRNNDDWVIRHWPVLLTLAMVVIWGVRQESTISNNTEKNYRLYLRFDEFKTDRKESTTEQRAMATNIIEIKEHMKSMDYRYVKRIEVDSRLLKTAYRQPN